MRCAHPLGTQVGKSTENDPVSNFEKEALQSWTAAEQFLDAYFRLIDQMPKDLIAL